MQFLRKRLAIKDGESVFCYINSVFAPGLDEGVGGLWGVSFCLCVILWDWVNELGEGVERMGYWDGLGGDFMVFCRLTFRAVLQDG